MFLFASAIAGFIITLIMLTTIKWILGLRRIVSTNEVHIVQSSSTTLSYGKDTGNGNTYYEWPSWIPFIGITKVVLPVSNFESVIENHKVYDKDRLPLFIDLTAFFRIEDSNVAAQRVSSFEELKDQLTAMIESIAINIMSTATVEDIMESRSELGEKFETEMKKYLPQWGVVTVRNLAIKDVKDADDSEAIANITEKRKSFIEMESRVEVAENKKKAEEAEIIANQSISVKRADAEQVIGERTVESQRAVEIKNQQARQEIQESARITKEKEMAVAQVENVKAAEINKEVQIILASQKAETAKIDAEAEKEVVTRSAEAELAKDKLFAEGLKAKQQAEADAKTKMELAPVTAQTTLAKEIGQNKEYQQYLITVEQVKANAQVGIEQAKALTAAKIQVIANAGNVTSGMKSALDIVTTPQGGTAAGMALQAFLQTPAGQQIANMVGLSTDDKKENE